MGSGAFALVLTLALVTHLAVGVTPAERKALGKAGRFSGSSLPGPAAGSSEILTSPLEGSQQDVGLVLQPTFSFTVRWRLRGTETAQMTAFLGQCYVGANGEETLHALWLLREAADSPTEDWKATRIGTRVFTRIK
ncbi:PREDICTED: avidin-like [Pygoscelis adeliae]|uniref:avidin-like n=1 Tax=Pygoscelis adeliae TaxID=9238 RepID=UPI0004F5038D|nr:PREDICTED: avidin-like [Pygoscelis adeliae]